MQKKQLSNQSTSGSGSVERRMKETSTPQEILLRPGIREVFRVHHGRDLGEKNTTNQDSEENS